MRLLGVNIPQLIVRRVLWVLTGLAVYAVLALFAPADAYAEPSCRGAAGSGSCATRAKAYSSCMYDVQTEIADRAPYSCELPNGPGAGYMPYYTSSWGFKTASSGWYPWATECPTGQEWDDATKTCATPHDPAECLAKNQSELYPSYGSGLKFASTHSAFCADGCAIDYDSPPETITMGGFSWFRGSASFTGAACSVTPPQAPPEGPPGEVCTPVAGQTLCVNEKGQHCYPTTAGRNICWNPGETGQKTDGPVVQVTEPGQSPPNTPTPPTPPPGEGLTQGPTTNTTINTTNTTINTNTTIYTTTNGTNAGGPGGTDSGKPQGTTTGPGGTGSGNTAGGGGDCDTPPTVTGDQALGMIATQAWRTRCAIEGIGEGNEGDDASMTGWIDGQLGGEESLFAEGETGSSFDTGILSFGSSCPALPSVSIGGQAWTPPNEFCQLIAVLRLLFIAVATLWGIRIVASE